MYWEYFGFKEAPFALTPNPAFLFLSAPHQEALAHLLFAIENRVGFIELSGEVGTGKTTLVRTLLNQLDESHRTALIFNPTLSPLGLLKEVNAEFGLPCDGNDMRDLHQALNRFLLEENSCGRTVVLVIDEAQNLSVEVLEQIRLISNLETESDKLIQIVLVGQPELNKLLARPELRQLDQRITVRYHLKPMDFGDTCHYIRHRIKAAADGREPLTFSPGALKRIFRFSRGLPRLINGVCDRSLLLAYTRECRVVSPSMAAVAVADLAKDAPRFASPMVFKRTAAGVLALALAGALFLAVASWQNAPPKIAAPAQVPPPKMALAKMAPATAGREFSVDAALKTLGASGEQENLLVATNAVLSAWQALPVQPAQGQTATVASLARQRGMVATTIPASLDTLARLDAPALLHVAVPGRGDRIIAVTASGPEGFRISPPLEGRAIVSRAELARIQYGKATLLWKDFHAISSGATAAERAAKVKLLQGLLKEVGCYNGPLNGKSGRKTQAAVMEFQRREQVVVDGNPAGQTLMLLYRRAGGFFPPSLSRQAGSAASSS